MKKYLLICFLLSIFVTPFSVAGDTTLKLLLNSPIEKNQPSQNCKSEICRALLNSINEAEARIDFAVYGLRGQPKILKALIRAQKRGVSIRGVIDKNTDNENYYSDTWRLERSFETIRSDYQKDMHTLRILSNKRRSGYKDRCARPEGHKGPLQCFEGKGYASKEDIFFKGDIMHHKFFVVDSHYVWTGSANISDTGIGGYNANNALFIGSQDVASVYTAEFNRMYEEGKYHRSKDVTKQATEITLQGRKKQRMLIAFSPQDYAVYSSVLPLLRDAKDSIEVAMFFLTHKNLSRELVAAHERGIKVRVIIDATGATNGYSKHKFLRRNGIPVKVETWGGKMHMKSALVDGRHLVIGSMNWTSAGESKNDENTIVMRDFPQAKRFSRFFNDMWSSIDDKWLHSDPRPESGESGSSCFDGIDNDFDRLVDSDDDGCEKDQSI